MQWNVWFEENIEEVASFLQSNMVDIICLQELTKGYIKQTQADTCEYLAGVLGYDMHVQEVPIITPTGQWTQANAIFSKFPIVRSSAVWLHEPRPGDEYDEQYRSYIEVGVDTGEGVLEVGTTHMSHVHQFSVTPQKEQEVRRLTDILDTKRHCYILTGDFNALPESYNVSEVSKRLRHAGPDFSQKTWTTKPHMFEDGEVSSLLWRYDYVFATPDLAVQSAEILDVRLSDHLPIRAVFELA